MEITNEQSTKLMTDRQLCVNCLEFGQCLANIWLLRLSYEISSYQLVQKSVIISFFIKNRPRLHRMSQKSIHC